jgi:hypothetical protein
MASSSAKTAPDDVCRNPAKIDDAVTARSNAMAALVGAAGMNDR